MYSFKIFPHKRKEVIWQWGKRSRELADIILIVRVKVTISRTRNTASVLWLSYHRGTTRTSL